MKARFQYNKCKHCEKYGGKPKTHVTDKCRKWNADGTSKNKEGSHGKEKKVHKAFAQLKSKTEHKEKLLKKLLKKTKSNKNKNKKSQRTYDSSDSDSDSS
jgi:hypothetical protein